MSWAFFVLQFRLNTLPVLVQMLMMDRFTALRKQGCIEKVHRIGSVKMRNFSRWFREVTWCST